MTLVISRSVVTAILAEAAADEGREVCGLVFGSAARIDAVQACENVADAPESTFEIDPVALLAAHRAARAAGPQIVGCYHSHPSGNASPSPRDAATAAGDGRVWLIVAGEQIAAFRAVPAGALHGRFDSVALVIDNGR